MAKAVRWITLLAMVVLLGCSLIDVDENRRLSITLTVDATSKAVDEEFTFAFTGEGQSLNGVILNYGDGSVDSVATMQSVTVSGQLDHAYSDPGSYTVIGRLEDATLGEDSAQVTVQVGG